MRVPSLPTFLSRRSSRVVLLGLLISLVWLLLLSASDKTSHGKKGHEKPYALIFGTVWGPDDHPVYGVRVKIRRADKKRRHWELYSDHNGEFGQRVPAGQADYLVWADLNDYKSLTGKRLQAGPEVKIHVENDERVDIGLHLK